MTNFWFYHPLKRLQLTVNKATELSNCGRLSPTPMPLMTHSYDTHHWPWHAAIYHKQTGKSHYVCGGTVISSKLILTAAHCARIDVKKVSVSLGRLNLDANENSDQSFAVAEVIVHPEFDIENLYNNIAIIKLSTDATFNHYVQPVCLWESSRTDLSEVVGKLGTVVGWGLTETGEQSNVLQEASFPLVSHLDCLRSDRDTFGQYLSENNFCAGHRNGTSACNGDSGGSMTFEENGRYYVREIVSNGLAKFNPITQQSVCDSMKYVVFTDVAKYLSWIEALLFSRRHEPTHCLA